MNDIVVSLDNITFGYKGKVPLFSDFSLEVKRGEAVGLLGPSGRGKSTLLDIVAGFTVPQKGFVSVQKCAMIFQDPFSSFHPTFTLYEQIRQCVPDFNAESALCVGLETEYLFQKPYRLSGGQLQRASILRALAMKPDIILADEPTSALDNTLALEIGQLLVTSLEKSAILLVTHDEVFASWLCDRVIRI